MEGGGGMKGWREGEGMERALVAVHGGGRVACRRHHSAMSSVLIRHW